MNVRNFGRVTCWLPVSSLVLTALLSGCRDDNPPPATRTDFDFAVTWRCDGCGGTTDAPAAPGSKVCPKCGKEMFVTREWSCAKHGVVRIAFQYDEKAQYSKVRIDRGAWQDYTPEVETKLYVCPKCNEYLRPVIPSPTAGA